MAGGGNALGSRVRTGAAWTAVRRMVVCLIGVAFPLHERLKGHDITRSRLAMERSQWWSPEALHQHQYERWTKPPTVLERVAEFAGLRSISGLTRVIQPRSIGRRVRPILDTEVKNACQQLMSDFASRSEPGVGERRVPLDARSNAALCIRGDRVVTRPTTPGRQR